MQSPASGQAAHERHGHALNVICGQDTHTDKVRVETLVQGLMSMQESVSKAGADSATSSLFLHAKGLSCEGLLFVSGEAGDRRFGRGARQAEGRAQKAFFITHFACAEGGFRWPMSRAFGKARYVRCMVSV